MRWVFMLALLAAMGCSMSIGMGGFQMGFGSGSQQCDSPMKCRIDCERREGP